MHCQMVIFYWLLLIFWPFDNVQNMRYNTLKYSEFELLNLIQCISYFIWHNMCCWKHVYYIYHLINGHFSYYSWRVHFVNLGATTNVRGLIPLWWAPKRRTCTLVSAFICLVWLFIKSLLYAIFCLNASH